MYGIAMTQYTIRQSMQFIPSRYFFSSLLGAMLVICIIATQQLAGSAEAASTDWQDIGGGKARMIAILAPDSGKVSGVVEIKLNAGWKTYWRSPGDSGIPPQMSFDGSKGYVQGEVFLPAPQKIKIDESVVVGYKSDVGFVFEGQMPSFDPANTIELEMFLGVCEQICIPAQASFKIPLSALNHSDPVSASLIAMARQSLPRKPSAESGIQRVVFSPRNLQIFANIPSSHTPPNLFVEGPPQWRLAPASLVRRKGGIAEFSLNLSQVPAKANITSEALRYTLVGENHSVEQWKKPD